MSRKPKTKDKRDVLFQLHRELHQVKLDHLLSLTNVLCYPAQEIKQTFKETE